ncbi:hypothetical protein RDI58_012641 [Solanum bulbocastanum]|uniref:Uncharacterized protein n=1 Tax=Solanum bulbocastanum TaxID=147425 RepID=A0AAN8TQ61_SOLBU
MISIGDQQGILYRFLTMMLYPT